MLISFKFWCRSPRLSLVADASTYRETHTDQAIFLKAKIIKSKLFKAFLRVFFKGFLGIFKFLRSYASHRPVLCSWYSLSAFERRIF